MHKVSDFKTRLESILTEHNIRATQLSRDSGVSKPTISQYLKGVYEPKHEQLCRMADALGVNPRWLEGYDAPKYLDEPPESVCRLPVFALSDLETPLRCEVCDPQHGENCFFVEADDHLYPVVNKGDLVLLEPTDSLLSGQTALIFFREYGGLYIFNTFDSGARLCCLNAYYPPVQVNGDELSELRIHGRVILSIKNWQ